MWRKGMIVVLSGCGLFQGDMKEERFAVALADTLCERLKECDRGEFEADYFGSRDCRNTQEHAVEDLIALRRAADCRYDQGAAADAVEDIGLMDCESFYEAVYVTGSFEPLLKVWTCEGGGA